MKNYSSREIIKMLKKNGWILERIVGSHHQFYHPVKHGIVTVPHPKKDFSIGTAKSILSQASLTVKDGVRL